jgi:hypothetical protein
MREKEEVESVTQYANVDIIFIGATVLSAVYIISNVYQIKISDRINLKNVPKTVAHHFWFVFYDWTIYKNCASLLFCFCRLFLGDNNNIILAGRGLISDN